MGKIKRKAARQGGQHYENRHKTKKWGTLQEQAQDKEGGNIKRKAARQGGHITRTGTRKKVGNIKRKAAKQTRKGGKIREQAQGGNIKRKAARQRRGKHKENNHKTNMFGGATFTRTVAFKTKKGAQ